MSIYKKIWTLHKQAEILATYNNKCFFFGKDDDAPNTTNVFYTFSYLKSYHILMIIF
jgi:hypothetical protein